jgi:lipoate-protein ligase A
MRFKNYSKCLSIGMLASLLVACNPWDEHVKVNDSNLDASVIEVLKQQPDLSTFANVLELTGYDSVLINAQSYTIFAPTNDAWTGVDMTNIDLLRGYVKNCVAFQSYPIVADVFSVSKIKMLNGKYLPTSGSTIDGIAIGEHNLLAANGVIHKVPSLLVPKKNIWEYISQSGYENYAQVKFLKAQSDSVMDMELSYQLGLDRNGRPYYDTVWVQTNEWLSRYGLNKEDSTYTLLLLDEVAFEKLKTKYTPYFTINRTVYDPVSLTYSQVTDVAGTEKQVTAEVSRDMILLPVKVTGDQTVVSVDGINVNVSLSSIDATYNASNGTIYEVGDLNVKMYQNKVKEILIEAENYVGMTMPNTTISKRMFSWASGGYDIVVSGRNVVGANNYYAYSSTTPTYCTNANNAALIYMPTLNSIPYKVYWKSYDDFASHIAANLQVSQKLLFSNPGSPMLTYTSSLVSNNFSDSIVFVGQNIAGINAETQLHMWQTITTPAATKNLRVALTPLLSHPDYNIDQLPCTSFGIASLWVCNSALVAGTNGGSIFLDYIRLVPVIDPDE